MQDRIIKLVSRLHAKKYAKRRIPKYAGRNRGFTDVELKRLLEAVQDDFFKTAFMVMAFQGLRIGEVVSMRTEDVDLLDCTLIVRNEKCSRIDLVPLNPLLLPALERRVQKSGNGWLFPSRVVEHGGWKGAGHVDDKTVRAKFREACTLAGLMETYGMAEDQKNPRKRKDGQMRRLFRLSPHSLRHYFITKTYYGTYDLQTTSKLARHRRVDTTSQIYIHTSKDQMAAALAKTFTEAGMSKEKEELTEFLEFYGAFRKRNRDDR